MVTVKREYREEEEEEEPESFYGHGMIWFRGPMMGTESSGNVYIGCRLRKPKRRRIFANNNLPGLFTVKSAISDSDLMAEAMVLDEVHGCSHIRQMLGEEFTASATSGKTVSNLLLEYCSGGNLAQLIKKTGRRGLPESIVRKYTRHVLLGLNRIHDEGYVYCALQPKNILLEPEDDTGTGTEYNAKLGDLGLAERVSNSEVQKVKNFGGIDVKYMAPETLVDNVLEPCSDIWSLGCVVVEMLLGFPMWDRMEDSEFADFLYDMAEGNCETQFIGNLSDEGKDFLKKCLVPKDERLMTAGMLLDHPFVREVDEEENITDKAIEAVEKALEEVNTLSRSSLEYTEEALEAGKELLDAAKELLEAAGKFAPSEKSDELSGLTMSEDFLPLQLDDVWPLEESEVIVSSPSDSYNNDDEENSELIIPSFPDIDDDEEESLPLGSVSSFGSDEQEADSHQNSRS